MRLPPIELDDLTDEQRSLYETLADRPEVRRHGMVGPFGVWMHAPAMGSAMAALGREVRFGASLPAAVTEVAICTTGAHFRSSFEFAAHRQMAIEAGVDPAALERLAAGADPGFAGDEQLAHDIAVELLSTHAMSDATSAAATDRFGPRGVVELVTTIGYYSLISLLLNGFDVPLPDGMRDPFAQEAGS